MMLDMYPQGLWVLAHINRALTRLLPCRALIQMGIGGGRKAATAISTFAAAPANARSLASAPLEGPHLHKVPLIRWQPGFCYVSSMHFALPRRLNRVFDARDGRPTGVLLTRNSCQM